MFYLCMVLKMRTLWATLVCYWRNGKPWKSENVRHELFSSGRLKPHLGPFVYFLCLHSLLNSTAIRRGKRVTCAVFQVDTKPVVES